MLLNPSLAEYQVLCSKVTTLREEIVSLEQLTAHQMDKVLNFVSITSLEQLTAHQTDLVVLEFVPIVLDILIEKVILMLDVQ